MTGNFNNSHSEPEHIVPSPSSSYSVERDCTSNERETDPITQRLKSVKSLRTKKPDSDRPINVNPLSYKIQILDSHDQSSNDIDNSESENNSNNCSNLCLQLRLENERLKKELLQVKEQKKELLELNMQYQHQSLTLWGRIGENLTNKDLFDANKSQPNNLYQANLNPLRFFKNEPTD
ncbi:hypothetical protein KQX54_011039 [Cotesia glomerata]|uniref:Uncharacterized protein n=1 Tax=Cotesia glomerata TaxID=32391 RepID=A0AAV7HU72_COTGL|nr:hypothetical protein KQX54_011039 [Cotesia glomerata]